VALDELLARADVIWLHLVLSEETRGFLGPAQIARIKPGAVLVNTARRAGRRRHVDRSATQRPHPPCRSGRLSQRAARARSRVGGDGKRHARTLEASMTLLRRGIDIVKGITEGRDPS
jgi:D-isomer specific 2-hydroxyacid dehydrogenase, NAD binding domain